MAHGEDNAKKVVLSQADSIQHLLENKNSKGDPEVHGAGILLLMQMIRPLFMAQFVTEDECESRREELEEHFSDRRVTPVVIPAKTPLSNKGALVTITGILAACTTVLRLFGKL